MAAEVEERVPIPNLALNALLIPAIKETAKCHHVDQTILDRIQGAFQKAELQAPGVCQDFVSAILKQESIPHNMNEILLLLSEKEIDALFIDRPEPGFQTLNKKAQKLKKTLCQIPKEIHDRSKFLQAIKEIASSIKELLDSVNDVLKSYITTGRMMEHKRNLEFHKKEFVKYSRSFSDTLKRYFKDSKEDSVYYSANKLISQTNSIIQEFQRALRQ
ncbi:programmed cell death protein 10-like [Xenia sp. Carnegie-2017]|uniref:programmed cell death protein 10-like n=1 Tax=Xenia sp. Carnegie-2017 TaxID=2897299 RepID=UPI001F04ADD5|nr:programmed cell death protein 10-like [Xenia sp. Carnegie-2017]